ncbi:tropomyosin-2-like [Diachasma alloeum]|uniref:tropomyosin-2-like n=1 Tax=Diachasma alloeum TaxID=454923 RepID=UPI0007381039|nr:tropomyosin-2-like [Diachasma alloeum]
MNAIKQQLQVLKIEKDLAIDRADCCDQQAREANKREEKLNDEVRELEKNLLQMENDLRISRDTLRKSNAKLDDKERMLLMVQSDLATLNRRMQQTMEYLEKTEERRIIAQAKLLQAAESAEDAKRICKGLENHSKQDYERMDQLTMQLKEVRLIAEDADAKSDEISRRLAFVEDQLEATEDRIRCSDAKIVEREDELFIVGNILKSLEVSEEKANQRVEAFKQQLKELKVKLKDAERRAVIAENQIKILQKELDIREDWLFREKQKSKYICDDMDSTFAALTGY